MYDKIPKEMQILPQWICWRLTNVSDGEGGFKQTKVPFRVDGRHASTTDPRDWTTFERACAALERGEFTGIGFVFTRDSGFVGVDLDKCRDPETGETEPWAKAILNELASYTELSQSERGWHVIVRASLPQGGNRKGRVEMYDHDRYFVMTGKRARGSSANIEARDLTDLHARLLARELDPQLDTPKPVRGVKGTDKSPSGKDFALIGSLARDLGTNNAKVIEAELRRRHPEHYASRDFVKYRQGGYWAYSIERFLKFKHDRMFRKPARIIVTKAT